MPRTGCHAITGRVLSADARAVLARESQRLGTVVLEDNIFSDFTLADQPPPLAAFAPRDAAVCTVGSLSKLIWNGLRVGWIRAPAALGDGIGFLREAERHGVRCAPGRAFSRQAAHAGCLRLMYVQPHDELRKGVDRLSRAWGEYGAPRCAAPSA
ncbi:MAG: aminotransferase class I/II-fold pyridoxal phosphate-dependent enzyme [Solirubrobacteraceae bacterium]